MRTNEEIILNAKNIILNSFIKENAQPGFPEIIGRNRSTEWGGTISALHVLSDMVPNEQVKEAIDRSIKDGILASQNTTTNAWGAGGVDLIEATSEIVYYLSKDYPKYKNVEESIKRAVEYIWSKYYDEGYFHSGAFSEKSEHTLYATYQAVRALVQVNELSNDKKNAIKKWIKSNTTADGLWRENNNSVQSSITHSIYALLTLLLLGDTPENIKNEYKKQINQIFKSIINNNTYFYYEEYSIPSGKSDSSGKEFNRIRINHFVLPLAISLFIRIRSFAKTRILIELLKKIRYDGAWGLYQTFRTTWATQQAIDALNEYNNRERSCLDVIPAFFIQLYFKYWYTVIILILLVLLVFFVLGSQNIKNLIVSFVLGVGTGILANKITG